MEDILVRLSKSKFRSKFHLSEKDKLYIDEKGMDTIERHAHDFIESRLAPKDLLNDGHQTPWKGHPVFVAQHATTTCCRNCLYKWHHIPKGRALTKKEQDYIVHIIMQWISNEKRNS